MKREGCQRGFVRSFFCSDLQHQLIDSRTKRRIINLIESPNTRNMAIKVPARPTNHSKYTSRCSRPRCRCCHEHPVCKSIDKVKGSRKLRSAADFKSSDRLITCRVFDDFPVGLKCSGFSSAKGMLDYLVSDVDRDNYDEYDDEIEDEISSVLVAEITEVDGDDELVVDLTYRNDIEEEEGRISFYEVGFALEAVDDDESWCLVEEL